MQQSIDVLKKVWGFTKFRPLQSEIIESVLRGHDTLALLPTGGGKSICFQVPGLMLEGLTIVISPLIALMQDQILHLKKKKVSATAIYSGMSRQAIDIALDNCIYGKIKFLYLSPERLKTEIFQQRITKMNISLVVVDEAHCISLWGYDFRPSYLEITDLRKLLPSTNVLALTATATPEVAQDIQDKLDLKKTQIFQKSFHRPNLSYSVFKEEDKEKKILQILTNVSGSAIIYVSTRRNTKLVCGYLRKQGIKADYYHGGLPNHERSQKQLKWLDNESRVIVATNAFGMGIDKPNVRVVIHFDIPESLEAYYQEAGRAGRDEKKSYTVVVYNQRDIEILKRNLLRNHPQPDFLKKVYQSLANYYKLAIGSGLMASYDFELDTFSGFIQIKRNLLYGAIKRLEEAGLIQLNEAYFNPSALKYNLTQKELSEFQVSNPRYGNISKALLRLYGGELFTDFVQVSEKRLAHFLELQLTEVEADLKALNQKRIILYHPQKTQSQLTFLTTRLDASKLPLNQKSLKQRKKIDQRKIKEMVNYLTNTRLCRSLIIQEYFGENSIKNCGKCDWCLSEKKNHRFLLDWDQIRSNIMDKLQDKNLTPEEIVNSLTPIEKKPLLEMLRIMLDHKELKYDQSGRLKLNPNTDG